MIKNSLQNEQLSSHIIQNTQRKKRNYVNLSDYANDLNDVDLGPVYMEVGDPR